MLVPYGRIDGLVSLEDGQANKKESKRKWEEELEANFMKWDLHGFG